MSEFALSADSGSHRDLMAVSPSGLESRWIVRSIVDEARRAFDTAVISVNWTTDENFQWDLLDGTGRFYVPALVFIHPAAATPDDERAAIGAIVEVTSPGSPGDGAGDRSAKPVQYARAGVPLYLLADRELASWTLYGLVPGQQRYQVTADGRFGDDIRLPAPLSFTLTTSRWPRWRSR